MVNPSNSNDFINIFTGYIDEIRYDELSLEAMVVSRLHIPLVNFHEGLIKGDVIGYLKILLLVCIQEKSKLQ